MGAEENFEGFEETPVVDKQPTKKKKSTSSAVGPDGTKKKKKSKKGQSKKMVVEDEPKGPIKDKAFIKKLEDMNNWEIIQADVITEALTLGLWTNSYVICDRDNMVPVVGHKKQATTGKPLFIIKEDPPEGCCETCCRGCLCGNHSFAARMYHLDTDPVTGVNACCGACCYTGHQYDVSEIDTTKPLMTFERPGCCQRCVGCPIFMKCCQNEMYMHPGSFNYAVGTSTPETADHFGRSITPIGGGGFIPTLNLTHKKDGKEEKFGKVTGPPCYGGWRGVICDTVFFMSSPGGKKGDIGKVVKRNPRSCFDCCVAICASVDSYKLKTTDKVKSMSVEQKATLLGNVLHLDYMFFESDLPPVIFIPFGDARSDSAGCCTICTFFQCYLCGSCVPVQLCFCCAAGGDG